MVKRKFEKPPCSEDELVDLLKKRGLSFQDEAKARRYLRFVGFYRLSGYMYPFQYKDKSAKDHHFRRLMSFDDILNIYIFDRDLKLLMTDALARIEVAFRAVLTNTMVAEGGPHWFLNSGFFKDTFDFEAHIEQCGVAVKWWPRAGLTGS